MSQKRKLFIIGNGFDLVHGLKTKYKDFRDWLVEEYVEDEYKCTLPEFTVGNHGEDVCTSLSELASFIIYMVDNACYSADDNPGDMWSDLESATSRFEFSDFLEYKAENEYDNLFYLVYNNEDNSDNIEKGLGSITDFFSDWIGTIDITGTDRLPIFSDLIDADDLFITFNYTDTLEDIYHINSDNVCHIHGRQGEEIFFGHKKEDNRTEEYLEKYVGSESNLQRLLELLEKDTERAYNIHKSFFERIKKSGFDEIYSYGFSFSEVDMFYIDVLCGLIETEGVTWYQNDYQCSEGSEEFLGVEEKLRESGFKGVLKTFKG